MFLLLLSMFIWWSTNVHLSLLKASVVVIALFLVILVNGDSLRLLLSFCGWDGWWVGSVVSKSFSCQTQLHLTFEVVQWLICGWDNSRHWLWPKTNWGRAVPSSGRLKLATHLTLSPMVYQLYYRIKNDSDCKISKNTFCSKKCCGWEEPAIYGQLGPNDDCVIVSPLCDTM